MVRDPRATDPQLAAPAQPDTELYLGQWRLAGIDVVNWGTFDGLHRIVVARKGHLFTGASGSGKSSLLDAVAAVLTPGNWIRFNAAAQDASVRGDDRGLVSYVRGAWSKEEAENEDRTVATYLRKRATWSGILLRYENAVDPPVTLVRLFHLPGTSTDQGDLKDMYLLLRDSVHLDELAPYANKGIEARRLKKDFPDAYVSTGSHGGFFTRLRRTLGIANEGALQLLHRTQSAKNLGSLDHLFRSFMLDQPETFKRANNATEQFGELREAHRHVVELRRQAEHLRSLAKVIADYEAAGRTADELSRLQGLQGIFQRRFELRLATADRGGLIVDQARAAAEAQRATRELEAAEETRRGAERREIELGGGDMTLLHARLEDARAEATRVDIRWQELQRELGRAGVSSEPRDAPEFAELQQTARSQLNAPSDEQSLDHATIASHVDAKRDIERIDAELAELRRRKSNIKPPLQAVRSWLCAETGLNEAQLPFGGELLSVRPEFVEWTGAIERVLRSFAGSLLVRDEHLARVRKLVEKRDLKTRLVIEAVPLSSDPPKRVSDDRSLIYRVQVSDGPFSEWLQSRLSQSFDIVCVDSPDELDTVARGVTIAGQVKLSARKYEKNDRVAIDNRAEWILGADNDAKIEYLLESRVAAEREARESQLLLDAAQRERDRVRGERDSLRRISEMSWDTVDRSAAATVVAAGQQEIDALSKTSTDLEAATQQANKARQAEATCHDTKRQADTGLAVLERELRELTDFIDGTAAELTGQNLDGVAEVDLEARYRAVQRNINRRNIADVGMKVVSKLREVARTADDLRSNALQRYTELVLVFGRQWPAVAADLTIEIEDRGGYLQLLETIESRGLPEHEQNFLRLLQDKSRDLIGHLLDDLRSAPRMVGERIDPVNASLARSQFDEGRFLHIQVKTKRSSEVKKFLDDLRTIVDGSWADEDLESSEQRYAVLEQVMNDLASDDNSTRAWRNRVLDTREHVTFLAQEIDIAGRVLNVHDSSAGLSGGQRQKLVIFCLAAALRYQLTSDEEDVPSYGTIVLDEAFDKADSRYTRMAMDVFVEFGFHMILATPQKLLQTLEPYLGAVTSVSNPTRALSRLAHVPMEKDEARGTFGSGAAERVTGVAG